jgi:hypothetical protein
MLAGRGFFFQHDHLGAMPTPELPRNRNTDHAGPDYQEVAGFLVHLFTQLVITVR